MLSDRIGQRWIFRPTAGLLGGEKHEDVTAIAVCTAFLLMGLLMSSAGIWVALQAHLTGLWPITTGSVVRVTLDENRTLTGVKWYPRVTYTYQADGHTITATRISLGDPVELTDEAEARKYLERYSPHSKVTVYFSEEDATESVLEQRAPAHSFVTIGFGIAIAFIGFALFLVFDLFRS